MNTRYLLIAAIVIAILLTGFGLYAWQQQATDSDNQATPSATPSPTSTSTPSENKDKPSASETPQPVEHTTQIYLVAIGDDAKPTFGCGDSLEGVTQKITTTAPLTETLTRLLALDDQYYGESGLYNALWQSDLSLESASLTDGVASIALTGSLKLGGTCDSPRVKEQLTATATQFATVDSVNITVNGQPLDEALSQK